MKNPVKFGPLDTNAKILLPICVMENKSSSFVCTVVDIVGAWCIIITRVDHSKSQERIFFVEAAATPPLCPVNKVGCVEYIAYAQGYLSTHTHMHACTHICMHTLHTHVCVL